MKSPFLSTATLLILVLSMAVPTTDLRGQNREAQVLDVVQRVFDAMRAADTAAVRALFHSEARLVAVDRRGPAPQIRVVPASAFAEALDSADQVWDERFWAPEVRVEGPLATVWTHYDFHLHSRFSHCGVNAFHLARTGEGWKILQVAYTRRAEDCSRPEEVR